MILSKKHTFASLIPFGLVAPWLLPIRALEHVSFEQSYEPQDDLNTFPLVFLDTSSWLLLGTISAKERKREREGWMSE